MKMLGLWNEPISQFEAEQLISNGAIMVDVREPNEYGDGHIPGAINVPLSTVEGSKELQGKSVILYCRSGMRSLDAMKKLQKKGHKEVYNFGGKDRWV